MLLVDFECAVQITGFEGCQGDVPGKVSVQKAGPVMRGQPIGKKYTTCRRIALLEQRVRERMCGICVLMSSRNGLLG